MPAHSGGKGNIVIFEILVDLYKTHLIIFLFLRQTILLIDLQSIYVYNTRLNKIFLQKYNLSLNDFL